MGWRGSLCIDKKEAVLKNIFYILVSVVLMLCTSFQDCVAQSDTVKLPYRIISITGDLCDGEYKITNRGQQDAVSRDLEEREMPCALTFPSINYNDSIIIGVIQTVSGKVEPTEIKGVYFSASTNEIILRHHIVSKGLPVKQFQKAFFVKVKRPADDVDIRIVKG
jgi:hypothetical protein